MRAAPLSGSAESLCHLLAAPLDNVGAGRIYFAECYQADGKAAGQGKDGTEHPHDAPFTKTGPRSCAFSL